ncbi:MAG: exo-alpha-sialidase [Deltaproteobacteria bacterium]|nr:exo-alpha-sialidase [Deltaproteobacteria bacterium]
MRQLYKWIVTLLLLAAAPAWGGGDPPVMLNFDQLLPLNREAAHDSTREVQARIAGDATGRWVGVWVSYSTSSGGIRYAVSRDDGRTYDTGGWLQEYRYLDEVGNPALATNGRGTWVAAWESITGLRFVRSGDGGETWSDPASLDPATAAEELTLAAGGGSHWVAAWLAPSSDPQGSRVIRVAHSSNDGASWNNPVTLSLPEGSFDAATAPVVVTDGRGTWLMTLGVYDTATQLLTGLIRVWRSRDNGVTWSPVASPMGLANCAAVSLDLAADGGRWGLLYERNCANGEKIVRVAYSDDAGTTWTPRVFVPVATRREGSGVSFAADGGIWLASWWQPDVGGDRVYAMRSRDSGLSWSDVTVVGYGREVDAAVGRPGSFALAFDTDESHPELRLDLGNDRDVVFTVQNELTDGGFEGYDPWEGTLPEIPQEWSGDQFSVVYAQFGVPLYHGYEYGRFDTTTSHGAGATSHAQLFQTAVLSFEALPRSPVARAEAWFNRREQSSDRRFKLRVDAYGGAVDGSDVYDLYVNDGWLAREIVYFDSDADPDTWEHVEVELPIPPGATYLLVEIAAVEDQQNDTVGVEFMGHYVDGVRLVVPEPSGRLGAATALACLALVAHRRRRR